MDNFYYGKMQISSYTLKSGASESTNYSIDQAAIVYFGYSRINVDSDSKWARVEYYYSSSPTGPFTQYFVRFYDNRNHGFQDPSNYGNLRYSRPYFYTTVSGYYRIGTSGEVAYLPAGIKIGKVNQHGSDIYQPVFSNSGNLHSLLTSSNILNNSKGWSNNNSNDNITNYAGTFPFSNSNYRVVFNNTCYDLNTFPFSSTNSNVIIVPKGTLSDSSLQKLSTLSTSVLEKLSTLSTSVLEKLSTLSTSVLTTIGQYDVKIIEQFMTEVLSNPNANITDNNYKEYFSYSELKMWSKVTQKIKKLNKDKLVESLNAIPEVDPTFKSSEMSTIEALFSNRTATETYTEHYDTGRNIYTAIASSIANMRG